MEEKKIERTIQNQCIIKKKTKKTKKTRLYNLSSSAVQKVERKKLNLCQEKRSVKEREDILDRSHV